MTMELQILYQYKEILRSQINGLYDQDVVDMQFVRELCQELGETVFAIKRLESPLEQRRV